MPRITFKDAQKIAKEAGFVLQTCRGGYEYWKHGEDHTTGEAATLTEALEDIGVW